MIEEFHSKEELLDRVYPALRARKKELQEKKQEITEMEIWNQLSKKWKNSKGLTLYDIIRDIFQYSPLNKEA